LHGEHHEPAAHVVEPLRPHPLGSSSSSSLCCRVGGHWWRCCRYSTPVYAAGCTMPAAAEPSAAARGETRTRTGMAPAPGPGGASRPTSSTSLAVASSSEGAWLPLRSSMVSSEGMIPAIRCTERVRDLSSSLV
jgi:hypothetical protein